MLFPRLPRIFGHSVQVKGHWKNHREASALQGLFFPSNNQRIHGPSSGGESIYGGKFADENFILQHEGAGLLSMANSGPHTNGSQFFIIFKPQVHLDDMLKLSHSHILMCGRKHVVFGKVVKGMDMVKKIEQAGSAGGQPARPVKILDCGETSESKIEDPVGKDSGKNKKAGKPSDDGPGDQVGGGSKKSVKDARKKRKRRYSSSDSEPSSSESDSDSSSSSSDGRHKKKRRSAKKDKYHHGRKLKYRQRERKRDKRDRRSRRKAKWSSESTSDTETNSSSTSSSSNDESPVSARKTNNSTQAGKKSIQSSDARGKFSTHLSVKEAVVEQQQRNDKPKTAEVGSSHEEGELTPKNDMHLNNGHGTSSKLCISPNQHFYSDDSDKSRRAIPNSKSRLNNSHRSSPNMSPEKVSRSPRFRSDSRNPVRKSGELGQGRSSRNPLGSPANKDHHEPSTSNHGQGLSHSRSPNGIPKCSRKGRGFTERYAYARKYRSPSPERAPWRYHYGGKILMGAIVIGKLPSYRSYSERSPPRRYRSPSRGRSSLRQGRQRSRSVSNSPGSHRGRYREPEPEPETKTGSRSSSRSKSSGSSLSRSPDSVPPKRIGRAASRSRSRSPSGQQGLVSYGDASPDAGIK
ncbi:peptidyl-prolyl cis-trans isomerase CYP [Salix suchowensis]|nr:peptidyl-prolyl cis-trans isomerase CYP [Salix suchowensis]